MMHFDDDAIQPDDGVDRIQRTVLPGAHFVQHAIGDLRNDGMRNLNPIQGLHQVLNVPHGHAFGVERQDLVLHPR